MRMRMKMMKKILRTTTNGKIDLYIIYIFLR